MNFLDPTNDVVFHAIFGQKERTSSLISLINAVLELEGEARVVNVSLSSGQIPPKLVDLKDTIVDVRATDGRGHEFIVEMQCKGGPTWMKRALFTTCKTYVNQLKRGKLHEALRPVYFIGILEFEMPWSDVLEPEVQPGRSGPRPQHERGGRDWLTHHVIKDAKTNLQSTNDFSMHFMELSVFDKDLSECVNVVEQWAWFFKHAREVSAIPNSISDDGLVEAFKIADEFGWDAESLDAIEKTQQFRALASSEMDWATQRSKDEGIDIGKELGKELGIDIGIDIGKELGKELGIDIGKELGKELGIDIGKELGKELGIDIGKELGKEQERRDLARRMTASGLSFGQVQAIVQVDADILREWLA
jgi:PD-(D/E)XK nuclease family transposase